MTSRDFAYWLQGFFEINGEVSELNAKQITMIKNHLNLVFHHEIDPQLAGSNPDVAETRQAIHDAKPQPNKDEEEAMFKQMEEEHRLRRKQLQDNHKNKSQSTDCGGVRQEPYPMKITC